MIGVRIICSYQCNDTNFAILFVYAPSTPNEKDSFWNEMVKTIIEINLQILLIGDLNEIKNDTEKLGGLTPSLLRYKWLLDIKTDLSLTTVP